MVSIFSDSAIYLNISAFLLIMVFSFLKTSHTLVIEVRFLFPCLLLLLLAFNVSFESNLGLSKSLAMISTACLIFYNRGLFDKQSNIDYFLHSIIVISLLKLFVFFLFLNINPISLLTNPAETRFLYSLYFNPIYLARSCGLGLIAAMFVKNKLYIRMAIILTLILGLYISGSRGPILALAVILLFYAIKSESVGILSKVFILVSLVFSSFFVLSSEFILRGNDSAEGAFEIRFKLINQAYELFIDNVIFGSGLGSFQNVSVLGYPHNILLEVSSELGLLGILVFSYIISNGVMKLRTTFFGVALIYTLFNSMFSGSIANNIAVLWFSLFCFRYIDEITDSKR